MLVIGYKCKNQEDFIRVLKCLLPRLPDYSPDDSEFLATKVLEEGYTIGREGTLIYNESPIVGYSLELPIDGRELVDIIEDLKDAMEIYPSLYNANSIMTKGD